MAAPLYIITTAYNASKYFDRYMYSLCSELKSLDFEVFVYIGIDNCLETLDKAMTWKNNNPEYKNILFFFTETNVGTYVLKNSLIGQIKHDKSIILFFDVDDIYISGFIYAYYNFCINVYKNTDFFIVRAMNYSVDDSVINSIFNDTTQVKLSQNLIESFAINNKFYELLINLLRFTVFNVESVENYDILPYALYKKIFTKLLEQKRKTCNINSCILNEISNDKYISTNNICNAIVYILKLYAFYSDDIDFVRKHQYLPTPACGVFFTSVECVKRLGMFNKYRVEQDNDFLKRAEMLNVDMIINGSLPFFIRSISPGSLTQDKITGYYTKYRKMIRKINEKLRERNYIIARGKCCNLQQI